MTGQVCEAGCQVRRCCVCARRAPRAASQPAVPARGTQTCPTSTTQTAGLDRLTWTLHFGRMSFSGFVLVFSLGFGFCSLPELRDFIVAAACLRIQSLLQYTESGCAAREHPGPIHFDAPGASATCGTERAGSSSVPPAPAGTRAPRLPGHASGLTISNRHGSGVFHAGKNMSLLLQSAGPALARGRAFTVTAGLGGGPRALPWPTGSGDSSTPRAFTPRARFRCRADGELVGCN